MSGMPLCFHQDGMVTATALPARVRLMMNPIHLMTFSCTCMPVHELKKLVPSRLQSAQG